MDKLDPNCAKTLVTVSVNCPIGNIEVSACDSGLHRLTRPLDPNSSSKLAALTNSIECDRFNSQAKVQLIGDSVQCDNKWINGAIDWLSAYFESPDRLSSVKEPPICPTLLRSEFNGKVWTTLMNGIKFGNTISYTELADRAVGKPTASRAVGTAMKRNPIILMIPCHRVIKKDGSAGQFSAGGNSVKEWLLSYEKKALSK